MRTVKAARFNAAERLERKHVLSLFAMSMVSLYFVGLSVWQAVYAPTLDEAANRLITLVSIMSSIFTLVLALIEFMNDYRMKAHHMHACALAVNDLYHELKLMRPGDAALLQEFRQRYNGAVRRCPYNHSRIDYLMAKAEDGDVPWEDRAWARLRYALDVYALYGLRPDRPAAGAGAVPVDAIACASAAALRSSGAVRQQGRQQSPQDQIVRYTLLPSWLKLGAGTSATSLAGAKQG